MNRLNYNHLYYFYIVASLGSIKEASEKLFVTQPTISDQLKLLEEYFKTSLFERRNRGLHLTKSGELAFDYAAKIFELGNELSAILINKELPIKKSLDIGVSFSMSQYFLYEDILPLLKPQDTKIHIHENEKHLLMAELEAENIDLLFTDTKESITSNMKAYKVGVNKTFVVAHKKFRKFKTHFPEKLSEISFVNYTKDSSLRYEIELYFSQNNLAPKVIAEADDINFFQVMIEQGLAFAIVPEVAKNRLCANKDTIVLGELEELETSVWAIVKKSYNGPALNFIKRRKK